MSEELHTCPDCGRANFTARGLKSHRCKRGITPSPLIIDPVSEAFATARQHAITIGAGVKTTVAACIALGLELNKLKAELGYQRGGARGSKANNLPLIPWRELVAHQTGFVYERCRAFCKTAEAVKAHLLETQGKAQASVREIVRNPPSAWTDVDYLDFADAVATHFQADTFNALMGDLGLLPASRPTKPVVEDPLDPEYVALRAAHACIAEPVLELARGMVSPDEFTRNIHSLPLDDIEPDSESGRPFGIAGLRTIAHHMSVIQQQIDSAIKSKTLSGR